MHATSGGFSLFCTWEIILIVLFYCLGKFSLPITRPQYIAPLVMQCSSACVLGLSEYFSALNDDGVQFPSPKFMF